MRNLFLLFAFAVILFCGCKKDAPNKTTCQPLSQHAGWTAEEFKADHTIQLPSNYEGTGRVGWEGKVFSKNRTDHKVNLGYRFCSSLYCEDYGSDLLDPNAATITVTAQNGQQITLNRRMDLCENGSLAGIFYHNDSQAALGKLYWKQSSNFKESLTVEYDKTLQSEVQDILKTIRKN